MAKTRLVFAFICVFFMSSFGAYAAEIKSALSANEVTFTINFEKGYSAVNLIKLDKSYVISFQTAEEIAYSEEFWDSVVSQAYIHAEGDRKKLIVEFNSEPAEPKLQTTDKTVIATFPFTTPPPMTETESTNVYIRMVTGLGITVVIILFIYWLSKKMLSRNVLSELPGTGRLLGKVDLDIRKSLVFYELGENIYIFGVTDMAINLVEKVTAEDEVNKIKSGFARKGEFGSYMNFFAKGSDVKTDLESSRSIVREKLKSIRKR